MRMMRAAVAVMAICGAVAWGQAPPTIDPADIRGRTFEGLRLPLAVTDGPVEFAASKVSLWAEQSPPRADGTAGVLVQRMLLVGDVRARLAGYDLSASRAVVWLAPLDPKDPDAAPGVWQVWVYLERGGSAVQAGGIKVSGDRLPVQGVVRAEGGSVRLKYDKPEQGRPSDPFVGEAERALATRLRQMVEGQGPPGRVPEELIRQGQPVPPIRARSPEEAPGDELRRIIDEDNRLARVASGRPIFAKGGIFTIIPKGDVVLVDQRNEAETAAGKPAQNAVVVEGGITVQYWDRLSDSTMQLTAERAVVFLEPGDAKDDLMRMDRDRVRGIYLEGDVVADMQGPDGHFNVRSPRVYYSVRDNRAVLVDAVFWTYDARLRLPLYVRAKTIEQESASQFKATAARMTNTPFFSPDLSIGASSVTIKPSQTAEGEKRVIVDARDVTLRAGKVPFFYLPKLKGDPKDVALRDLTVGASSESGWAVKTTWNARSLLGLETVGDVNADLMADWYFDRGPAIGTDVSWQNRGASGGLFAYLVPDDTGTDVLPTGEKKDHDHETRGMITGEHRAVLSERWTLFAEGAYISDETFLDGFFRDQAIDHREFASSLYFRRLSENSALTLLGKTNIMDFIPNEYLLQTPGYTVEKYPEVGYTRLADDLLKEHPGLLTYSSVWRLTEMRMQFPEVTPASLGFSTLARSQSIFGVNPGQPISEGLRAQGLTEEAVTRFDTRHELNMPLSAGPVNITPFLAGRFTGYNDDFEHFSPEAEEAYRLWGSAGVRVATEIQHVDNSVESRMFDLHRLRHIIQPSVTVWTAGTSIDRVDLPVYDDEVEAIAEGTAARFAVDQTFQTQRGGPGRWRSVDVFKLNAEVVTSSGDVDRRSPVGRYFDFQPELGSLGDTFATVDATWQVTEVMGIGANMVYDFHIDQPAREDIGITIQQNPDFMAYVDMRYLNAEDSTTFIMGALYDLTKKYSVSGSLTYDTNTSQIQSVSGEVRRAYPNVIFGVGVSYNTITGETGLGFVLQPVGVTRGSARMRGLGTGSVGGIGG